MVWHSRRSSVRTSLRGPASRVSTLVSACWRVGLRVEASCGGGREPSRRHHETPSQKAATTGGSALGTVPAARRPGPCSSARGSSARGSSARDSSARGSSAANGSAANG